MSGAYDTLVIGAGQAGLAAGYYLERSGVNFALLDGGDEIGDSWARRWDSLRLFTPARYDALPGLPFPGARDSLPTKDQVAEYLKGYAKRFDLPVQLRTPVSALRRKGELYAVTTANGDTLEARSIIVATGANQHPRVPAFAAALRPPIVQLHSSSYRGPSQLPAGGVLVVGAGNSGAQIALELAESGRRVVLSGPATGWFPRRFLGRDIYDWLWPTLMRPSVDSVLGRRLMKGRLFSGDPLVGITPAALAHRHLLRAGRTVGARDGLPLLQDGSAVAGIAAVVWCTGFRPDFGWIELPVLGLDGYPIHRRGLAMDAPGLAFLGMRYQHRMSSALLGGVGEDAAYVVSRTVHFLRGLHASTTAQGERIGNSVSPSADAA